MRTIAMQLRQSQGTLAPSLVRPESPARVRRALDRANPEFAAHATVIDVIGGRLRDRLDVLATRPARVLDLGCRTGYQLAALAELYPQARITGVDPARQVQTVWSSIALSGLGLMATRTRLDSSICTILATPCWRRDLQLLFWIETM